MYFFLSWVDCRYATLYLQIKVLKHGHLYDLNALPILRELCTFPPSFIGYLLTYISVHSVHEVPKTMFFSVKTLHLMIHLKVQRHGERRNVLLSGYGCTHASISRRACGIGSIYHTYVKLSMRGARPRSSHAPLRDFGLASK